MSDFFGLLDEKSLSFEVFLTENEKNNATLFGIPIDSVLYLDVTRYNHNNTTT